MARNMTPEEHQEVGRRMYKLKQYEQAAEAFTRGIGIAPTLSLFDHRAAAYDRLEDYNAAVKDGREMIKLEKKNVKGYLRTASVLEKMEKLETALGIYKYGMKNVPVSDKNFKLLQQLHDKITRKLSPAKSVDPLTILPVELAEMILEYLTFRHMVNCMRVSKGWRDYIANLHRLWMHLDLSGARRPVSRKFVDKAVRRSENRLTRLTIHRFEHVDVLKNVAKVCRDLTELEFISLPHTMASTLIDIVACAPKLEKFVVRPDITLDTASQILNTRPTLQHVGFPAVKPPRYSATWKGPFPVLAAFHLHFTDAAIWTNLSLDTLLPLTLGLKTLDLGNVHYSPGWVENHLSSVPLTTLHLKLTQCRHPIPALPATLQRLSIESTGPAIQLSDETLYLQTSNLPALTHLSLINFSNLDPARLSKFLDPSEPEPAAPLTSLSLAGLLGDTCPSLAQLLLSSPRILTPSLSHLHVATLPVTDDEIEALVARAPGLISVDVSRTNITGAGVKMLVDGCPGLKSVKADGCVRISGRDVVEWARGRGVWVSARMEEGRGGKKVRY